MSTHTSTHTQTQIHTGLSPTSRTASSTQGSVPSSSNSIVMLSSEAGKETECIEIYGSQVSMKRKLDAGAGVHDNDSRAIEQCDGKSIYSRT